MIQLQIKAHSYCPPCYSSHSLWTNIEFATGLRTHKSLCESLNAIIPSFHDIEFIMDNNLVDANQNIQRSAEEVDTSDNTDQTKATGEYNSFFVDTKFHFENNSWTWANGGQIKPSEWFAFEGYDPVSPVTPIQVQFSRILRLDSK